ncbi:MerR family transcriptional regulator [Plantactinospora sp. ZYX-F-223]|uniref:MerR family transcriptional regulator n=1 Tax=Plantactinospora sp. ZYX-F-223 TaxID=3144103 RepID=UPI0031FE10B3
MWRIGELAGMVGVSERTLRHYDKIGLLVPATVDRTTGYRWYGVTELSRLERIRGLQHLGLSLRQIADILDAPDAHLRQALAETVAALRRDIAVKAAAVAAAEDRLARPMSVLPQQATVGGRRLNVRYLRIGHPSELAVRCPPPAAALLTWLSGQPTGNFLAAVTAEHSGERLDLPARTVVRAIVPPATGVVRAGLDLFDWLYRRGLTVSGPTLEEHLVDADAASATVLEVPVRPATLPAHLAADETTTGALGRRR